MKKFKVIFLFAMLIFISACNKTDKVNEDMISININVYDKEAKEIYNQEISTNEKYLSEAIKDIEDLNVITVDSEYGEYITSILDISEGDNYYWNYYINDEYAQVGISSCKVEDGKTYTFKIERYTND